MRERRSTHDALADLPRIDRDDLERLPEVLRRQHVDVPVDHCLGGPKGDKDAAALGGGDVQAAASAHAGLLRYGGDLRVESLAVVARSGDPDLTVFLVASV